MHDIEPHYNWRDRYEAAKDSKSPFFRRTYDEFKYSKKIYNYYIHPQWDAFGSPTLYMKILYADYENGYAIFEMMGEWNDAVTNDIMFLKREIADEMALHGIHKYLVFCDNVLNFHGEDDDYYEEWYEDVRDEDGWICFLNLLDHVEVEMRDTRLQNYVNFGPDFNNFSWRKLKPDLLCRAVEMMVVGEVPKFLR
jgi:hypothetical protein